MDYHAEMQLERAIPRSALLLGWLGVLPFAALSFACVFASPQAASRAIAALILYAAIILAFMGGAQWGVGMLAKARGPAVLARRLGISVLPALAAFAMPALPARTALLGLATVFVALLASDIASARAGVAPAWYPALRIPLTIAVVLCLLLAAGFGKT